MKTALLELLEGQKRIEERLDRVEDRLNRVEERLDRIEERLDRLEARQDRVESKLDILGQMYGRHDLNIKELQRAVGLG